MYILTQCIYPLNVYTHTMYVPTQCIYPLNVYTQSIYIPTQYIYPLDVYTTRYMCTHSIRYVASTEKALRSAAPLVKKENNMQQRLWKRKKTTCSTYFPRKDQSQCQDENPVWKEHEKRWAGSSFDMHDARVAPCFSANKTHKSVSSVRMCCLLLGTPSHAMA